MMLGHPSLFSTYTLPTPIPSHLSGYVTRQLRSSDEAHEAHVVVGVTGDDAFLVHALTFGNRCLLEMFRIFHDEIRIAYTTSVGKA